MPSATRKPDPSLTAVRRKPSLDFSVTGLVYCSMMMFMGLAAINSQANLLFGVFGLMIGILCITSAINWLMLRKLTITRTLPENGVVGEPLGMNYEVRNDKWFWPTLSVTIAELDGAEAFIKQPHAYLLHAASKYSAIVPAELVPKRRGLHKLSAFQISTSFPFGFIKRAIERAVPDTLLIYPPIARVNTKIFTLFRSAESSGMSMRPRGGGMDEFYGVKEYRRGENPRHIYWRRSARTGELILKEMTHVSPPRILLLVDTFIDDDTDPQLLRNVERGIAIAASLVDAAIGASLMVGMLVRGEKDWIQVIPNRGKRQRRDMLGMLARLPINRTHNHAALVDEAFAQTTSGETAVLITPRKIHVGLGERARGATVVVSATDTSMMSLFTFDPKIDFLHCMPREGRDEGVKG